MMQTAERVSGTDLSDNFVYQRSRLAYFEAAQIISGNVLEIGTGSGYGVEILSPVCDRFTTIDKNTPPIDLTGYPNVEFVNTKVPPLHTFPANMFDFVVSFQVIEHIRDDFAFIRETHRVLKEGGMLILTTPNRPMSLTRNPWHIREYTADQLHNLLSCRFTDISVMGVAGNEKVMEYYRENRRSVARIMRYDIFRINRWLPKFLLRVPYDIMNRLNRRKLLERNTGLTAGITMGDYQLTETGDKWFDLFAVARKRSVM